jgi:hypothetical protein
MIGESMNSDTKSKIATCCLMVAGIVLGGVLSGCAGQAAPIVSSVSPTHLSPAGGTAVTINGANFKPDMLVMFGSNPAPTVQWVNSTELIVTAPKSATMAMVPVSVASATLSSGVTYDLDGITCSGAVCTYAGDAYFNSFGANANIQQCTGSPDNNAAGNINAQGKNWVIINDIQVPTTGNYTMTVYAGTMAVRDFAAYVNGSTSMIDVNITTPGTGWYVPAPPVSVQVPLIAGQNNNIEFTGNPNGSYWSPNLCYITIGPGH